VDATAVPPELNRDTDHVPVFPPPPAGTGRAILRDAFEKRIGIAVLEFSARKPSMLLSCIQVPLAVFFLTPLIRPLKASQLLFTYLVRCFRAADVGGCSVSPVRDCESDSASGADYVWER